MKRHKYTKKSGYAKEKINTSGIILCGRARDWSCKERENRGVLQGLQEVAYIFVYGYAGRMRAGCRRAMMAGEASSGQ